MTDYHQQALYFLANTGTEFGIKYLRTGKHFPDDKEDRDIYRFALRNSKGEYRAEFGDSLHNTQRRRFARAGLEALFYYEVTPFDYGYPIAQAQALGFKVTDGTISKAQLIAARNFRPTAYDVLACLQKSDPGTFADFVSNYGYDDQPLVEYPQVMGIYHAALREYTALQRIFTTEELKSLQEIS